ncbi:SDR family NAD(P)-dependent oxidoreductase [Gordonia soli]|nr:SDR family NAD(P)-dependent oxidoreductase [Gordonia soli]
MTGASRGIGRYAAEKLLAGDPNLHLVVLGRAEGNSTLATSLTRFARRLMTVDVDLASLDDTRAAAETVVDRVSAGDLPPLRGFLGNAGLQFADDRHETVDGLETTFAVNVIANHVLLGALVPAVTAPARLVITASDTHFGDLRHTGGLVPAPRWTDPAALARTGAFGDANPVTAGRRAYSTSKLAVIHLVHEWARRLPDGVEIVSYNPSFVPNTGLARDASRRDRYANRWLLPAITVTPFFDSVPTAGRKLADVALGRIPAPSGAYIDRTRVIPSSGESYDADRERMLWDFLGGLLASNP